MRPSNINKENTLTVENRFLKVGDQWYEILSIFIDIITEKAIILFNKGHYEEETFIIDEKCRLVTENLDEKNVTIKEELPLDEKFRVKTSYPIDSEEVLVFNDTNKRVKFYKKIESNVLEFRKLKTEKVNIKYLSKQPGKDHFDKFLREICSSNTLANNILTAIKRMLSSKELKYEIK